MRDDKLFGYVLKRPVYPVGPIVTQSGNVSRNGLLFDWLNKQPNDSMVYVSFGSGATLLHEQMTNVSFFVPRKMYILLLFDGYYNSNVTSFGVYLNFYLFLI